MAARRLINLAEVKCQSIEGGYLEVSAERSAEWTRTNFFGIETQNSMYIQVITQNLDLLDQLDVLEVVLFVIHRVSRFQMFSDASLRILKHWSVA